MWTSYSARHAAQLIGLPESAVRSCIRDGLVGTPGAVPAQLSFRDLSALRTVKALVDAGVPLPRVRKELLLIQARLPAGTSIAELTVEARNGRCACAATATRRRCGRGPARAAVRASRSIAGAARGELRELPRPPDAPVPVRGAAGDRRSVDVARAGARGARSGRRDRCVSALAAAAAGLHRGVDQPRPAVRREQRCRCGARCFRSALELDPAEATAYYNLGVLAQDAGKESRGDRAVSARARARSAARRGALQPRDAVRSDRRLARRRSVTSTSTGS